MSSDAEIEVQHLYRMRDKGILTIDEFASAMEKIQKKRSPRSTPVTSPKSPYSAKTPPRAGV